MKFTANLIMPIMLFHHFISVYVNFVCNTFSQGNFCFEGESTLHDLCQMKCNPVKDFILAYGVLCEGVSNVIPLSCIYSKFSCAIYSS